MVSPVFLLYAYINQGCRGSSCHRQGEAKKPSLLHRCRLLWMYWCCLEPLTWLRSTLACSCSDVHMFISSPVLGRPSACAAVAVGPLGLVCCTLLAKTSSAYMYSCIVLHWTPVRPWPPVSTGQRAGLTSAWLGPLQALLLLIGLYIVQGVRFSTPSHSQLLRDSPHVATEVVTQISPGTREGSIRDVLTRRVCNQQFTWLGALCLRYCERRQGLASEKIAILGSAPVLGLCTLAAKPADTCGVGHLQHMGCVVGLRYGARREG